MLHFHKKQGGCLLCVDLQHSVWHQITSALTWTNTIHSQKNATGIVSNISSAAYFVHFTASFAPYTALLTQSSVLVTSEHPSSLKNVCSLCGFPTCAQWRAVMIKDLCFCLITVLQGLKIWQGKWVTFQHNFASVGFLSQGKLLFELNRNKNQYYKNTVC